ncbi:MAG: cell division protein FtsQ/DivIB [Patescibacteria group bacterium]|nr:cell division protein FtsQ/DivIB [Patescibacteria group bacterium]
MRGRKLRQIRKGFLKRRNPQIYSRTTAIASGRNPLKIFKYVGFFLLTVLVYIVIFSPAFKVKKVIISGLEMANSQKLEKKFLGKNLIFLRTQAVSENIEGDQKVKELKVEKNYFSGTLRIMVILREPFVILTEKGKRYLVDTDGILFKEIGETEEKSLNLIKINNNLISFSHNLGDELIEQKKLFFLKDLINNFPTKTAETISAISFDNSNDEITVLANSNYKIFFDLKRSIDSQIESVVMIKDETEKSKRKLEYIDLRIETRIFYK